MTQLNFLIEKGISIYGNQAALAAAIGVPDTHISMWKKGKKTCTPRSRVKLAIAAKEDITTAALDAILDDATVDGDDTLATAIRKQLAKVRKL